jgi:hypothetical protein
MTPAARALELFLTRPPQANKVDWLTNALLALAADAPLLSLGLVPDETGAGLTFEATDQFGTVSSRDASPLRLFRTVLARLAKLAEEERQAEFNPYEGQFSFDRVGPTGPVRIDVQFRNTGRGACLTLSRTAPSAVMGNPLAAPTTTN